MQNKILVLNVEVSGMNKFLFSQLKKRGWDLAVEDIPYPKSYRWRGLISTFHPNISMWKRRLNAQIGRLNKSSGAFLWRTRYCQNKIKESGSVDIIFQVSGMFAPYISGNGSFSRGPDYVLMLSYTMALSNKYPEWMPQPAEIDKWLKLENDLYKNARLIFTTNENAKKSLLNDYSINTEKVIKVGYGLTLDDMPEFTKTYDGKTILFIGIDFERKGGFVLLDAFKKARRVVPDARLFIVGPNKDMYKIHEPGVEMIGYTRDKERLENLYKQASVFVMPSLCEPFGLAFLEAMAFKLPCIGTNIDAIPEIIEDGKTGFLVAPNDADCLKERIITLLNSAESLKKMGESAYEKVKEEFNWGKVGERIDIALKAIINK